LQEPIKTLAEIKAELNPHTLPKAPYKQFPCAFHAYSPESQAYILNLKKYGPPGEDERKGEIKIFKFKPPGV